MLIHFGIFDKSKTWMQMHGVYDSRVGNPQAAAISAELQCPSEQAIGWEGQHPPPRGSFLVDPPRTSKDLVCFGWGFGVPKDLQLAPNLGCCECGLYIVLKHTVDMSCKRILQINTRGRKAH